jgi:hypothetical protein
VVADRGRDEPCLLPIKIQEYKDDRMEGKKKRATREARATCKNIEWNVQASGR